MREAIAAVVRTIFAQPDHASALAQLRKVAEGLRVRFPRAATVPENAAEDILAYRHFPLAHQRQLLGTEHAGAAEQGDQASLERRRDLPNPAAVIRLVGAILIKQDDEWAVAERRYFSAESMQDATTPALSSTAQEILAAIA